MTLDEFEKLANAATPADKPVNQLKDEDEAFYYACRVFVPGMIEALTAARHALRALDSGQAVISCSALHKWLSDTFTKLETP